MTGKRKARHKKLAQRAARKKAWREVQRRERRFKSAEHAMDRAADALREGVGQ